MFFVAIYENGQLMAHVPIAGARGTLGRSAGNDIVVLRAQVSSRHLQIVLTEQGFELLDLRSTNGTWVNGVRLSGATKIAARERVRIAQLSIELLTEPFPEANGYFNLLKDDAPAIDRTTTSEMPVDDDDPGTSGSS